MIPFLGPVIFLSLFGRFTDPVHHIYYEDNHLRIQSTFVGVLGPPRIDVYEKHWLYEQHLSRPEYWGMEIDSVKVSYDEDSTRIKIYDPYVYDESTPQKPIVIALAKVD